MSASEDKDPYERFRNKISLEESKSFSTCPPSGNRFDGLLLASRKDAAPASWLCPGRACMCKTRRILASSGEVHEENVLGNLLFLDS
jgi:hypothetical protein